MHMSLCLDKPIMAGFLGSFAPCSVSTLAGRHDDADVICLTRVPVNNPTPAMQSERRALAQKRRLYETCQGGFKAPSGQRKTSSCRPSGRIKLCRRDATPLLA